MGRRQRALARIAARDIAAQMPDVPARARAETPVQLQAEIDRLHAAEYAAHLRLLDLQREALDERARVIRDTREIRDGARRQAVELLAAAHRDRVAILAGQPQAAARTARLAELQAENGRQAVADIRRWIAANPAAAVLAGLVPVAAQSAATPTPTPIGSRPVQSVDLASDLDSSGNAWVEIEAARAAASRAAWMRDLPPVSAAMPRRAPVTHGAWLEID